MYTRLTIIEKQLDAAEIDIRTDADEMSFFLINDSTRFVHALERIYEAENLIRLALDKPSLGLGELVEHVVDIGYRNRVRQNGNTVLRYRVFYECKSSDFDSDSLLLGKLSGLCDDFEVYPQGIYFEIIIQGVSHQSTKPIVQVLD